MKQKGRWPTFDRKFALASLQQKFITIVLTDNVVLRCYISNLMYENEQSFNRKQYLS